VISSFYRSLKVTLHEAYLFIYIQVSGPWVIFSQSKFERVEFLLHTESAI